MGWAYRPTTTRQDCIIRNERDGLLYLEQSRKEMDTLVSLGVTHIGFSYYWFLTIGSKFRWKFTQGAEMAPSPDSHYKICYSQFLK